MKCDARKRSQRLASQSKPEACTAWAIADRALTTQHMYSLPKFHHEAHQMHPVDIILRACARFACAIEPSVPHPGGGLDFLS